MVEAGEFRHDLYHRLNVITLPMPSLAQRRDDIPLLIEHFIKEFSTRHNLPARKFSDVQMNKLCQLPWKGNVRELRNYIERCIILAEGETLDEIPPPTADTRCSDSLCGDFISLSELERQHIRQVIAKVNGNQNKAAKILGISRTTLWRKLNERDQMAENHHSRPSKQPLRHGLACISNIGTISAPINTEAGFLSSVFFGLSQVRTCWLR